MYTSIFLNPAECLDKSLVEFCRECLIHIESKWSILMLKLKLFQTVGRHDSSSPFGRRRCRSHGRRALRSLGRAAAEQARLHGVARNCECPAQHGSFSVPGGKASRGNCPWVQFSEATWTCWLEFFAKREALTAATGFLITLVQLFVDGQLFTFSFGNRRQQSKNGRICFWMNNRKSLEFS